MSRHLRVLREAGLVRSEVVAQQRVYHLERAALGELDAWLERFRPPSVAADGPAARLDALDTELHRGRRARRAEQTDTVEVDDRDAR